MGRNVKGSIFIDVVKTIKKDKSGVYDTYLTLEEWKILSQQIMPSTWYPYETYKTCLKAIFEIIAKNDFRVAKEWGRTSCQNIMPSIYSSVLKNCSPLSFLKKFETVYRSYYDFGNTEIVEEGKTQAVYKLSEFDAQFTVIHYTIRGWIERGLELCGAKHVKSEFVTKSWEGQPFTSIRFTWT